MGLEDNVHFKPLFFKVISFFLPELPEYSYGYPFILQNCLYIHSFCAVCQKLLVASLMYNKYLYDILILIY